MADHRVFPSLLEIELTESLALSDMPSTRANMVRLRTAGVHLAIDDFGTGYSNLSQLAKLPFTTLKIDKSLIDGIGRSAKEDAILEAIVDMGQRLGYSIVAEGVETANQQALLEKIDSSIIYQGYHFARPMLAEDFDEWERDRVVGSLARQL
jgi:EAL domain-containing protein (putative c-di-GMP-specific phosphodiesterase class I)